MTIGVLGCGNMGSAIVRAWHRFRPETFLLVDRHEEKQAALISECSGARAVRDLKELEACDVILIGVKPQGFSQLALEIKEVLSRDVTLISILAGTSVSKLQQSLGRSKVMRVMPNTPLLVGQGVSLVYFSSEVEASVKETLMEVFASFSLVHSVGKEEEIDFITGVTGSGPAYFFQLAAIFTDYLKGKGVEGQKAYALARETILGSALLMKQSADPPELLQKKVTSKGGTTAAALEALDWRERVMDALDKAHRRSVELGAL